MALITVKPTSAGRRAVVRVSTPGLHKGAPYAPLTEAQPKTGGRNHYGRITTRHKGGGSKQHYRIIDFKRDKENIACKIERIEYDPNRTAHIALLCFVDGERRYIIAPKGAKVGDQLMSGRDAPIKVGNSLPLRNIPIGSVVHCIEMKPGKGRRSRVRPAPRRSSSRVSRATPRYACVRAKCARFRRIAAPRSAKSAIPNTTSRSSARPAPRVGAACVRRFAARP
jgi:large subunit ribosomal protein L2